MSGTDWRQVRQDLEEDIDSRRVEQVFFGLPEAVKVRLLEHMGFVRTRADHGSACQSRTEGLCCDCVPPDSRWRAPAMVRNYLGESWEARTEYGATRSLSINDGIGDPPETWGI